jgi:hypothetical protein
MIVGRPNIEFLPGVPAEHVLERLAKAGGKEVESGKLLSLQSSAALAINTIGWFIDKPSDLPIFPGLGPENWPAISVEVEYSARFPWSGGRHPWLDAFIETDKTIIGIESKRFEPFRDKKAVNLSDAYNRPVWGDHMGPFERLRDELRSGNEVFKYLDAVQLVKHAFGLITEGRKKSKRPYLLYLYVEPSQLSGVAIPEAKLEEHRQEIERFSTVVKGAEVQFYAVTYRSWLESWLLERDDLAEHRSRVVDRFAL